MKENASLFHIVIIHLLVCVDRSLVSSGEVQTVGKLKYVNYIKIFIAW